MSEIQKYTYKLKLSYKGTNYSGWQNQTSTPQTVQNYVEKVLAPIAKYKDFQVIGASRTDTGVHASGQVLKVVLPKDIEPTKLIQGMNSKLPSDIKVISAEYIDKKFNVNLDSTYKEYHYYFTLDKIESAISSEIIYSIPKKVDFEKMNQACSLIIGEHNFLSFCTPGSNSRSTKREILSCSIEETTFLTNTMKVYYLKIQAKGFLKYMVRILMGAIWDIGSGELTLQELKDSLACGDKNGVRTKAPAKGLHLININYKKIT